MHPKELCHMALADAGADLGLRDAGYFALDALRVEMGRRAWGAEIGPDETPFEAGMMFAVKLDKVAPFIGQAALREKQGQLFPDPLSDQEPVLLCH